MSITFARYPHSQAAPGTPVRASHCVCVEGPMIVRGDEHCHRCGKYPKDTIADTWHRRAAQIARNREKKAA